MKLSIETLSELIRAYAKATGSISSKVTRDGFLAAHKGTIRKSQEFDAIWSLAKSMASEGAVAAPPVEALPVGHRVKGVSTLVDAAGNVRAQWIKTDEERDKQDSLARLLESLPSRVPERRPVLRTTDDAHETDRVAVYPWGDPHFGSLAWRRETGESWDLDIAAETYRRAIDDLVERGPRTHTAMLCNLGDLLHVDGPGGTTTAGTPQDTDGRWCKTIETALGTITHMVDRLAERHARVIVDFQIGNHDTGSSIILAVALAAHYRGVTHVEVPVTPSPYHYYRFGSVLVGTTHGDRCKPEELGEVMTADVPELVGQTRHRYWLTGHVHHKRTFDLRSCTVESFRTMAGRDAWHHAQGYRARRDMQRIVYHLDHGEVSREVASFGYLMGAA